MKLALVGPIKPYRGGISQYTTQLAHALRNSCALTLISFKRQYPNWIYPGKSDLEPGQEDQKDQQANYCLDIFSPVSWLRAADRIAMDGCKVTIISWWTIVWAMPFALLAKRLSKQGISCVFLCHNLADHGASKLRAWLSWQVLALADGYIVHSEEQRKQLEYRWPDKPVLQRPHPIYGQFPEPTGILPKRGKLEILFFGFIRPYKGLEILISALDRLQDSEIHLTIAGESWSDPHELQSLCQLIPSVDLCLGYASDTESAEYFDRADIVVLPYLSATGSGVASLAFHYGKPILASSVGGLKDVVIDNQTGWLVPPGSASALANSISRISRADALACRPHIERFVEENSWSSMSQDIIDFCGTAQKS
ncbi:glycosyltransferase family 4 protein [Pseudoxanthomonas kalamensis]|uniref:glycosyltransferase family 4 protein n=1 Tax=Pseudoxanthomonas kalamensis TaxID=289483 RepID=UPI001391D007|nr:glycosyltransferase family 4 protein [Pseudoxanthomonas kalamensis]